MNINNPKEDDLYMIIGCYNNGEENSLFLFKFNQNNGNFKLLDSCKLINPSFLTIAENGQFVYVVNEIKNDNASITALKIDRQNEKLKFINSTITKGASPCYIISNKKMVITANYRGGSMSVFPIKEDGSIGKINNIFKGSTGGTDTKRQNQKHIHCVCFSPDQKYIFASDFSSDKILKFVINKDIGITDNHEYWSVAVHDGFGPRHIVFSYNGKYMYVIGELAGIIKIFIYSDGNLQEIQTILADEEYARGSADIHISPDGKYLYVSHRLKKDRITIYSINATNGKLVKIGSKKTGIHPRQFNITPNGKFLLVTCRNDGFIQILETNKRNGLLHDTRKRIYIYQAACIQFTI